MTSKTMVVFTPEDVSEAEEERFHSASMPRGRWSTDFGLRRQPEIKKETPVTKFIVIATVIGIVLFTVLYTCIFLVQEVALETATITTNSTTMAPEKLININEKLAKQPPQPFLNHMRGPPPASFIPLSTYTTAGPFPQLQSYARPSGGGGYPRNIQDIINYIEPQKQLETKLRAQHSRNSLKFPGNHDPFYSFKPKDPSDINLLATASLRFAPPVWKEIKSNPLPSQSIQRPYEAAPPLKRQQKPIMLALNVFPSPNDANRQNYFGYAANGGSPRYIMNGNRQVRPRKMIIHLNVYPNEEELHDYDEMERSNINEHNLDELEDLVPAHADADGRSE